ncbi:MAG TPA: right-handed parallel beta-helix repeat-containing protein [Labilithrix sp.]
MAETRIDVQVDTNHASPDGKKSPNTCPSCESHYDDDELAAALATNAASIALDAGTYGPIVVDRDVDLFGRCPAQTSVKNTASGGHGIEIRGAHTVSIRSLTVTGTEYGLWASDGAKIAVTQSQFSGDGAAAWIQANATLTLTHSLVAGTTQPMADGILVARGGHAVLQDVELRDMHIALQAFGGSTATASGLVVSDRSPEPLSALVIASHGGDVTVDRSLIFAQKTFAGGSSETDPRETGSIPSRLRITNSDLLRVDPTDAGAFDVSGGSTLELVNTTLETRARIAISAESGAIVNLERTVIRPVLPTDPAAFGLGAGLVINDGVQLTLDRTAILGVSESAVMASQACHIHLVGSLIADTWEFARTDLGKRGASGQAISLAGSASLDMEDSTLADNAGVAIWADRGGQTNVSVRGSAVIVTREPARSTEVAGILAWKGVVDVRDSLVHGIPGTALALGDVMGAVAGTTISKSDVAFRLFGASATVDAATADVPPEPGQIVTNGNVLVETATEQATDPLPLGDCRCSKPASTP